MNEIVSNENFFPIRVLSARTGVGHSTLRAWERRYGLIKPHRTPKGHRLYHENDIRLIEHTLSLLKEGHSISSASNIIKKSANTNQPKENIGTIYNNDSLAISVPWPDYISRMISAVEDFSTQRLDALYNEASSLYPLELITTKLILPALKLLGERWENNESGIAEEHLFTAWLRIKLSARLHHSTTLATGNKILVACLPGQRHEMGALLFTLAALGRGYQVIYLGADMPLSPIPYTVKRSGAKAVVLAGSNISNPDQILAQLQMMKKKLACPIYVGGEFSLSQHSALLANDIDPVGEEIALAVHLISAKLPVNT